MLNHQNKQSFVATFDGLRTRALLLQVQKASYKVISSKPVCFLAPTENSLKNGKIKALSLIVAFNLIVFLLYIIKWQK
jgi:hypothetical protein